MPNPCPTLLLGLTLLVAIGHHQPASGQVALPNFEIFGKHVSTPQVVASVNDGDAEPIYPAELNLILEQGTIIGVVFIYPPDVTFESVIASIDQRYQECRYDETDGKYDIALWRNEVERFGMAARAHNPFSELEGASVFAMWLDRHLVQTESDAPEEP